VKTSQFFYSDKMFCRWLVVLLFTILLVPVTQVSVNRLMPKDNVVQSSYKHLQPIFLPASYQMPKSFDVKRPVSNYTIDEYVRLHNQQPGHHIVTTNWIGGG